jgi:Pentapeptide repeats (9 copies)
VHFDGVTFQGPTRFREATFKGDARFAESPFTGEATTFKGETWFFPETTFEQDAWFAKATFQDSVWFNEATFQSRAGFGETTFTGEASFAGATFQKGAEFDQATFKSHAAFHLATFENTAEFSGATFGGNAGFDKATFKATFKPISSALEGHERDKDAVRAADVFFSKAAGFDGATFEGDAGFNGATVQGEAGFASTTFEQARQLGPMLVGKQLVLDQAIFKQRIQVEVGQQRSVAGTLSSASASSYGCAGPLSCWMMRTWPAHPSLSASPPSPTWTRRASPGTGGGCRPRPGVSVLGPDCYQRTARTSPA